MSPPIIHDIAFNHPFHPEPLTPLEKQIEIYVTLEQEICYDYRHQPSYQTLYESATEAFKTMNESSNYGSVRFPSEGIDHARLQRCIDAQLSDVRLSRRTPFWVYSGNEVSSPNALVGRYLFLLT